MGGGAGGEQQLWIGFAFNMEMNPPLIVTTGLTDPKGRIVDSRWTFGINGLFSILAIDQEDEWRRREIRKKETK